MEGTHLSLLLDVRRALNLSQQELATVMDSSLRTVQRMHAGRAEPSRRQYGLLVRATHPKDAVLAARIAAWVNGTLEEFGIAPPPAPPAPPPSAPAAPAVSIHAVDSVLCAAADVADLPLSLVRRILAAAFGRARELGVSVEMAADTLCAVEPPP
jgi:hypothetical protein